MSDVGRVGGIGSLDCMPICESDLMIREEAYSRRAGVPEGSDGSAWVGMEAFGPVDKKEGGGNDIEGVSWGGCEGTVFKGDDGLVEVEVNRNGGGKVVLVGG